MAEDITIRALTPGDVDNVVRIDRERSGRVRTGFYAKRFRTLAEDPRSVVAVAAHQGRRLVGFAFAHLLDGEFGSASPVGVLDAIGVLPEEQREGVATALVAGLERALAARGVRELRTQADWTEHGIAAFFSARGFRLAPRIVLERALERPVGDEFAWEDLPVR
jgi:GNAT superfamily N-acetyltransferase